MNANPTSAASVTGTESFLDVLHADGPLPELANEMALYGQFVGDWEADFIDYAPDGSRRTSRGEGHFAWVLEGRAIQDVWIVPPRASRQPGAPADGNRYGTTLRVYDPATGLWHLTWINPVTGVRNTLVGRRQGDEIVQQGKNEDGSLIRWTFSEITRQSFRWRGEASTDDGKSWHLAVEFFARRLR